MNHAHVLLFHELMATATDACPVPSMGTSSAFGTCLHTEEGRTPHSGGLMSLGLQTQYQQTRPKTLGSNLVLLTNPGKDFDQIGSGSS